MWTCRSLLFACSCAVPVAVRASTFILANEQQLAHQADAVVVARVESAHPSYDPASKIVSTAVRLQPLEVLKGSPPAVLELVELGGETDTVAARFFGTPSYRPGEHVLAFVSRRSNGTWATTSLALGKYSIVSGGGRPFAVRDLGDGSTALEWDGRSLKPVSARAVYDWENLRSSVLAAVSGRIAPRATPLQLEPEAAGELYVAPFALMSGTGRWFEADRGEPVDYLVDARGDAALGPQQTSAAVAAAMAAWSDPAIATIVLRHAGDTAPGKFDCASPTQIVFDDPDNVISDPWFCTGILALGGYCSDQSVTSTVNGVSFSRITSAKILFNNGWGQCPFWNTCNVAEVLTHELGHTIGIGHSGDNRATMFAFAHFDGRCAALRADDLAAVSFIYPASDSLHDAVVVPPARAKARIRRGKPEVFMPLAVSLRHGDTWGDRARFRLVARDGTCPPGTVGTPNFGMFADAPDLVDLPPGGQAKATVWLRLQASAFDSSSSSDPARCELEFAAEAVADRNIDPVPGNEAVVVALDVIDENDMVAREPTARLALAQVKPLDLRLPRAKAGVTKTVRVKIRSGAAADTVTVSVDRGDCPDGLVQTALVPKAGRAFSGVAMPSNGNITAEIPVTFSKEMVYSVFPRSPVRCTARITVSGQNPDGNMANNTLPWVIDLQDDNDL
ncbi:MAG: hypothetical protein KatS3mg077_1349 [Candidatus Binatia bacterium]|nr:MAG: hypothetical protein KatS3mg077_1349 [Candidatus Binatia bacterium]